MTQLHPTENRGYRELYAFARALSTHAADLSRRMAGLEAASALTELSRVAEALAGDWSELMADRGVVAGPNADAAGRGLALARAWLRDPALERDRALRLIAGEVEVVAVQCEYLAAAAVRREDAEVARFLEARAGAVRAAQQRLREQIRALAAEPDVAVARVHDNPVGRVAQSAGYVVGAYGEWADRRLRGR